MSSDSRPLVVWLRVRLECDAELVPGQCAAAVQEQERKQHPPAAPAPLRHQLASHPQFELSEQPRLNTEGRASGSAAGDQGRAGGERCLRSWGG